MTEKTHYQSTLRAFEESKESITVIKGHEAYNAICDALGATLMLEQEVRSNNLGHISIRRTTKGQIFIAHFDGIGGGKGKETYITADTLAQAVKGLIKELYG